MTKTTHSLVFTNTYVAFLKYVSFYSLERMNTNGRVCYSYVNDQLRNVYTYGEILLSEDRKECRPICILYQNMVFSFVCIEDVVILTDLCRPSEWQHENILLGTRENEQIKSDNILYHNFYNYVNKKDCIAISTYNAFYSFADATGNTADLSLNHQLFSKFDEYLPIPPFGPMFEDNDSRSPFKYIRIGTTVIIYDYKRALSEPHIYSDDIAAENAMALYDLESWGSFTDEGIYPDFLY